MKLTWSVSTLALREPFRISRSVMTSREAVEVVLSEDGAEGRGEVVTSVYYGLDVHRIVGLLGGFAVPPTPEELLADLPDAPAGVRAALDVAAHDLIARRRGVAVHELVGLPGWTDVPTARTIGLTEPAHAARTAEALVRQGFSVLKVKAGSDDLARVAAVRAVAPAARLLLDPNGGWTREQAVRTLDDLAPFGVEAVEQPTAPGNPDDLAWVSARSPVPVIADEDAETAADVRALAGAVHGVNVKLAKCGGIGAALDIVAAAAAGGLGVMLGCLVASSLGIAPAAHLTGHARWVDLDGHLLLARDPWTGIGGEDGVLRASGPGLGVRPR